MELNSSIRKIISETIENHMHLKNYTVNVETASKNGQDNFIGVIYRICIKNDVETENDESKSTSLILKVAPQNKDHRDKFNLRGLFLREIYIYKDVSNIFRQFEQSKGVCEENGFRHFSKCFKTLDMHYSECVPLEDLSTQNFVTINRHNENITVEHVRLVLQSLAKFHAISFALKDQQPEDFNQTISNLDEVLFRRNDATLRKRLSNAVECVFNILSAEEDIHLLNKVTAVFDKDALDIAVDCLSLDLGSVISHGDAWQNNFMFKYDNRGTPIDVRFLDWQIARYSLPIIDITYFIFCCTSKELRDKHYGELLRFYHGCLSEQIRRLGSDPENLFPYRKMLVHFQTFAKFGLILATLFLPLIAMESGQVDNLDNIAEKIDDGKKHLANNFASDESRDKFKKRMRDIIIDMVEMEYI